MFTPYDWQEGIGNRAQYIEAKLAHGSPAIAVSLDSGILVFTYRRQAHKVYEIYDRLIFAAIGQQSDVEALRVAAVEFTHQEGYNRSEQDVTIQRVAAALSSPLKRSFGDFTTAPLVARSLFGELNATPDDDLYYTLDYDGDYAVSKRCAAIAGRDDIQARLRTALEGFDPKLTATRALKELAEIWAASLDPESEQDDDTQIGELRPEALLLERSADRENRFRKLTPDTT